MFCRHLPSALNKILIFFVFVFPLFSSQFAAAANLNIASDQTLAADCVQVDPLTWKITLGNENLQGSDSDVWKDSTDRFRHDLPHRCIERWVSPLLHDANPDSVLATSNVELQADESNWTVALRFDDLNAVAYGNNLLVAVGEDGTVLTSPDAVNWTRRNTGTLNRLTGIVWSGNQFVAVGHNGTILTSPDGVIWAVRNAGTTSYLDGVTWGGGQFVAVGGSTILISADGVTWSSFSLASSNTYLNAVVWSGTQFVAVGVQDNGSSWVSAIFTSPNGVAWTQRGQGVSTGILFDVAWNGSQFVAVGYVTLTSPDGVTWTLRNNDYSPQRIIWNGSQFVGIRGSSVWISTDGVTWTSVNAGVSSDLVDATWTGSQFVAVGEDSVILTSPDGINWTTRTLGITHDLLSIASNGAQFVAVGRYGSILTSPDGVNWTPRTSGITSWLYASSWLYDVTWGNNQFVAVGNNGILTSPDGVTWTSRTSDTFLPKLYGVTWGNNQFVAVGDQHSTGELAVVLTSPDGVTWTPRTTVVKSNLSDVIWGGNQFVAVGYDYSANLAIILTSPDGINWTSRDTGDSQYGYLGAVAWNGSQFVVVGGYGYRFVSPDGVTWTSYRDYSLSVGRVIGVNGQFVAVGGYGLIHTSPDGVTWTTEFAGTTSNLSAIAWNGRQLVAVGGIIVRRSQTSSFGSAVGVFRDGQWFLDANGNGVWDGCDTEFCFSGFGQAGDMPASGNWDGGSKSYIGVLRSGTGEWFIDRNGNRQWDGCTTDGCYVGFGAPGDLPVAGDWTGSGFAKIGVFRNGQWYLDNGNGKWDGCGTELCLSFGQALDLPVAGHWDSGLKAGVGVFRAGTWYLDYNGNGQWDGCQQDGGQDVCLYGSFGQAGDLPAAGDWNGDGKAKVGVFRAGTWYLDYNGNGAWDGCGVDRCYEGSFGTAGDLPVAGKW